MSVQFTAGRFAADDDAGNPLVGGLLYTYASGTTTPKATYTSSTLGTANTNPVVLDARGEAQVWLGSGAYTMVLKTAAGVTVWSVDGVSDGSLADQIEVNDGASGSLFTTLQGFIDYMKTAGATFISFIQGGSGAVYRSVQEKLRESVSVRDFGAVGNGTTDDTAAIQAAIDYCTNLSIRKQKLYFPAANAAAVYKITAPLVVNGRLSIVADGEFATIIRAFGFSTGDAAIYFDNEPADNVYFSGVKNITIQSDNGLATGIKIKNTSYFNADGLNLVNLTNGIEITGSICFSNTFKNVVGYQISGSTVKMDSFTGGGQYVFESCTFNGNDGFYLTNSAVTDSLSFHGCNFEQCLTTDIYIAGSVRGLSISGCRSEGLNGPASFLIRPETGKSASGISVTGCFWQSDFGNAYAVSIGGASGNVKGFNITGNDAGYIGFLGFVNLNGSGESGVISGNYCENAPTAAVGLPREGVVVYANSNSSGALPEYWGDATWGVEEGTWTPVDGSAAGLTFSPSVAKYTKVGRLVTLQLQMTFPTTVSTAQIEISGLPFPAGASSCATAFIDTNKTGNSSIAVIRSSTSTSRMFFVDQNSAYYNNAAFSGKLITLSLTYTI